MDHDFQAHTSREWRYVLRHSPEVKVTARSTDFCEVHTARLVDLSQHGAKFISSNRVSPDESIRVKLDIEEMGLSFYVAGDVCWTHSGPGDTWVCGCSLEPGLPAGVFESLARSGQVDRRFDPRFEQHVNLRAQWELDGRAHAVTLQDYSRGGFCVHSSRGGETGERFHLRLTEPTYLLVIAKSVWQLQVRDGFLIGCSFFNERDFDRLQRLVEPSVETAAVLQAPALD